MAQIKQRVLLLCEVGEGEDAATEMILEKNNDKNVNHQQVLDPIVSLADSLKTEDQDKLEEEHNRTKGKKGEGGSYTILI